MSAGRQSGFTVLELLIVIVIFSLIVVMLTGGQRFAVRAWAAQERQIEQQADVGAVQNAIRQLLVSGRSFQGDDKSLHWIGALPRALNKGGLFEIDLKVEDNKMFITWRPHFSGPMPMADPERADLASDVTDFALSYLVSQPSRPAAWMDTASKDKKPALIRVTARLSQGFWPPLFISPMLDGTVAAPAPAPGVAPGNAPQGAASAAPVGPGQGQNVN